jgi:non-specific serine/threonine protein kinase
MATPNNLPVQLTSFVGRERETAQIRQLLADTRLLTLTGLGGSGKTRLALQVASTLLDEYPAGVYMVGFAALTDPALVPQAVAVTLGIREQSDLFLVTAITEHLRTDKLLLIFDNCEHLLEACASLAYTLLSACPHLQIMATSREPLGITGELVWRVPPLSAPDPDRPPTPEELTNYEAVRLFVERARFKRSSFDITPATTPAIAYLCAQLGGLPLAIEMAAARISVLSVEQIAARLDDSLRLLTTGSRTALPRQHSLDATMAWSYNLLTDPERHLMRTLSVFAGSFTLESAHAVSANQDEYVTLDLLTRLVDRSLLNVEERGGEARYRMLEPVRQYAFEKAAQAGEVETLRRRHLTWYLELARRAANEYRGPDQARWYDRIEAEHDNLRAALQWSLSDGGDAAQGLQLAAALYWFWYVRGYLSEGRHWLETALDKATSALPADRALALYGAGLLARAQGEYSEAQQFYTAALHVYRDLSDAERIANVLNNLGILAINQGDYARATALLKESIAIREKQGDRQGVAMSLSNLANIATDQGDYALARSYLEQSIPVIRELGNKRLLAVQLNNMGYVARCLGQYAEARSFVEESLAIKQALADQVEIASSLHKLAEIECYLGNYEQAERRAREGLDLLHGLGHTEATAMLLNALADILRRRGDLESARATFQQALATSREKWITSDSLYGLGCVARQQGDHQRAAAFFREALLSYRHTGAKRGIAECLMGIAEVAAHYGLTEQAAQLLGAADSLFAATGYKLHPQDAEDLKHGQVEVAGRLGRAAWDRALAAGRALSAEGAAELALQVVQDVLHRVKAPKKLEQAVALASKSRTRYPNDLTRREVDVLRLLAEGLTDAQIAERLFLSPHTVHAHIYSIYSKLNVKTRAAATRFALSHNLA